MSTLRALYQRIAVSQTTEEWKDAFIALAVFLALFGPLIWALTAVH